MSAKQVVQELLRSLSPEALAELMQRVKGGANVAEDDVRKRAAVAARTFSSPQASLWYQPRRR